MGDKCAPFCLELFDFFEVWLEVGPEKRKLFESCTERILIFFGTIRLFKYSMNNLIDFEILTSRQIRLWLYTCLTTVLFFEFDDVELPIIYFIERYFGLRNIRGEVCFKMKDLLTRVFMDENNAILDSSKEIKNLQKLLKGTEVENKNLFLFVYLVCRERSMCLNREEYSKILKVCRRIDRIVTSSDKQYKWARNLIMNKETDIYLRRKGSLFGTIRETRIKCSELRATKLLRNPK